jgi:16S rRNA (uracil1498-N3)-methyltransferase
MKEGAIVQALDGKGNAALSKMHINSDQQVILEFCEKILPSSAEKDAVAIHLGLCVLKAPTMANVIQKCAQLGVAEISPLISERSILPLKNEKKTHFQNRWQSIADQSLKQSGRLTLLKINPLISLEHFLSEKKHLLWCDTSTQDCPHLAEQIYSQPQSPITLLIGPEGGFSLKEQTQIRADATAVHLGHLTLKADTATLFAVSVIQSVHQIRKAQKKESNFMGKQ